MIKPKTKHSTRIRNLITISALTAIVLTTATYAWFVGMQTVNVTSFDVEIKSTDSLMLSLDGKRWSSELTVSEENLSEVSYAGNTNNWGKLIPVSTVGEMDIEASRMMLYEKASFTATPGGYRLMASRVDNTLGQAEKEGYVVFDLFIHNFSGRQYIENLEPLDEEAIYLTTDSQAAVQLNGADPGVDGTGIENSVRVAFTQIGRVNGTTNVQNTITGISCNGTEDADTHVWSVSTTPGGVTGICRTARVWEPNDTKHVVAANSWYQKSCRLRTGDTVTDPGSYTLATPCAGIVDGTAYPTFSVVKPIASGDNVDVYDGDATSYNTYTGSAEFLSDNSANVFTDTNRDETGNARKAFMTLAPNSITKVRVYVYIEGQDIDNYDFSSIGKKIAVTFGFTKERYTTNDIQYTDDPNAPPIDTTRPVITLDDDSDITTAVGTDWSTIAPTATATDDVDGDITGSIVVNTSELALDVDGKIQAAAGTYYVTYDVMDKTGNHAGQKSVKVIVQ